MINIDDFKKLEIKIGKIISAEKIPEGDKLLKLVFDIGGKSGEANNTRQVMSGIAEFFPDPSVLLGKEMPVLVNLESRKLRGYESNGMIMAVTDNERVVLLTPESEVAPGSSVN